MIYLPFSKFVDSGEQIQAPGASITQEGQALVRLLSAPSQGVTVSGGVAGEIFAGFVLSGTSATPYLPANASKLETFVVPAGGSVTLSMTPVSGQVGIYDVTTSAAVPITGGVTLTGKTIAGLTVGDTVNVTYRYTLTVTQARALVGDVQPGGYIGDYVGQVGTVKRGVIYTDQFDASKNWAVATGIKLAANGQITDQSGSGVAISANVVALPTTDVPFLGIQFDIE